MPKDKAEQTDFDPDKQYHIEVRQAVPLPGNEQMVLRPSDHSIVVSGDIANRIKDVIVTSVEFVEKT